jgi:hypothetical protein
MLLFLPPLAALGGPPGAWRASMLTSECDRGCFLAHTLEAPGVQWLCPSGLGHQTSAGVSFIRRMAQLYWLPGWELWRDHWVRLAWAAVCHRRIHSAVWGQSECVIEYQTSVCHSLIISNLRCECCALASSIVVLHRSFARAHHPAGSVATCGVAILNVAFETIALIEAGLLLVVID